MFSFKKQLSSKSCQFFNYQSLQQELIIYEYMSPNPVFLLILEFFPAGLAMLPYGLDSNVTKLLANLLTKPSVFYYFPNCIL